MSADRQRPVGPPLPRPRYGAAALSDLLPAALAALGVPGEANVLQLPPARRVCVLLVDGLGWELLRAHPQAAPYLSSLAAAGRPLHAGFPATTATSLVSLGTGRPPGEHGMFGYEMVVAADGREEILNSLRWDDHVDPLRLQPGSTAFERAEAAGISVSRVAPGAFRDSGLTVAGLRGGDYVEAETAGERAALTAAALRRGERALVYVYYGDLDSTGHRQGCASESWLLQLAHVDRLAEQIADGLPADAVLIVTADHGMVDVAPHRRVDTDTTPELLTGVRHIAGEPRAVYVHAQPGAACDVHAAWSELLGDRMWVLTRQQAIDAGWFGPAVADCLRPRIGDVVAAAYGDAAVVGSRRMPPSMLALVGMHGSLTSAEADVPLLIATRRS